MSGQVSACQFNICNLSLTSAQHTTATSTTMNLRLWTWIPLTCDKEAACEGMWRSCSCYKSILKEGAGRPFSVLIVCILNVYNYSRAACMQHACVCGRGHEYTMHVWMLFIPTSAEETLVHFNVVPNSQLMDAYSWWAQTRAAVAVTLGVGEMGGIRGGGQDEACLSECVTCPDQRIFLIKVPYPFYHAYPHFD